MAVSSPGCSEMLMAKVVTDLASRTPGKEAVAMESFAKALRMVRAHGMSLCKMPKADICLLYNCIVSHCQFQPTSSSTAQQLQIQPLLTSEYKGIKYVHVANQRIFLTFDIFGGRTVNIL